MDGGGGIWWDVAEAQRKVVMDRDSRRGRGQITLTGTWAVAVDVDRGP